MKKDCDEWTLETLKLYLESKISTVVEGIELRDKAIQTAREGVEYRLEGMNELREQITEERGNQVARDLYEGNKEAVANQLQMMNARLATLEGKKIGISGAIGWIIGALGVAVAILTAWLKN